MHTKVRFPITKLTPRLRPESASIAILLLLLFVIILFLFMFVTAQAARGQVHQMTCSCTARTTFGPMMTAGAQRKSL